MERDNTSACRQRLKRKRTEDARKRESAQLLGELQDLEAQLTKLKGETTSYQGTSTKSTSHTRSPEGELEHTRHEMLLYIASLGCLLLQRTPEHVAAPMHTYIHLSCSMEARRRTILELRPSQLQLGRELVEQRSKFLDTTHPQASNEWNTTDKNDVCGLHFYVEQLHGAHSVHCAFSVAAAYISSYEVTPKKTVSVLTYHEENGTIGNHGANVQLSVLLKTPDGPMVEANSLIFSEYDPEENVGIIVSNYVDKDDLRPHEPTKRLVQEVTAVCLLSPFPNGDGVIIRHWVFMRARHAPHLLEDVDFGPFARQNQVHSGEDLVNYVRNQLLASQRP